MPKPRKFAPTFDAQTHSWTVSVRGKRGEDRAVVVARRTSVQPERWAVHLEARSASGSACSRVLALAEYVTERDALADMARRAEAANPASPTAAEGERVGFPLLPHRPILDVGAVPLAESISGDSAVSPGAKPTTDEGAGID